MNDIPMRAQTVADGTTLPPPSDADSGPAPVQPTTAPGTAPSTVPSGSTVTPVSTPPAAHRPGYQPVERHPDGAPSPKPDPKPDHRAIPKKSVPHGGSTSRSTTSTTSSTTAPTTTSTTSGTVTSTSTAPVDTVTVTSTTTQPPVTVSVAPTQTIVITPPPVTVTVTTTVTAGAGTLPASTGGGTVPSGPWTSTGWHSGASGDAAASGAFGNWRGKPIQATAVWGDTSAAEQASIGALDAYNGFDGDVDVSVGALAPGDTWSQAAAGAYTERWRTAIRSIQARRSGHQGTVYIRFAHEMNGDWFDWKVTSGNVNDFHTAWRLFRTLLGQEYPAAKLVFSPNSGNHSDVPISQIYPGDDVVDVVGVDYYDGWPDINDQATWDAEVNRVEQGDQPYGPGAWQKFAAAHGKPLSFPEWGLRSGDHPAFIKAMHDFLAANAAPVGTIDPAGKVIYDVYFDIANSGNSGFMLTGGANPRAAEMYKSLSWGV